MSETLLSSRNLAFELYEVLDAEGLTQRERFAEHNRETFDAAISTARNIAEKYFAPHNRKNDENEPRYENGAAILIPEVKPAVDAFLEAGFLNANRDFEVGGMQLPSLVSQACFAHFQAANAGTTAYPFLTMGAANLIESFGSDEQKRLFLQPMIEGRFFGTMALTEPHAGSSLSDIRTRAEPAADGSYRIKGNKIFISGGDHPLSENIVHMVLAKLPDAPAGVKGISLFIVPKFLVNDDGSLGKRNDVVLAGLFHKMGWRGTTSTALNFGDNGDCVGYLVGKPFGKTKLLPKVSPGKTLEGLVGGLLFVLLFVTAVAAACQWPNELMLWYLAAVLLTLLSVFGDLSESMFKRVAGLKDSGSIFPGHGGMLDRIDSLTATAPLFAIFVALFAAFFPVGLLANISNSGTLFAFAAVSVAVLVIRRREPGRHRPFRTPAIYVTSPLAFLGCLYLFYKLDEKSQMLFVIWAVLIAVLAWVVEHHSNVSQPD